MRLTFTTLAFFFCNKPICFAVKHTETGLEECSLFSNSPKTLSDY